MFPNGQGFYIEGFPEYSVSDRKGSELLDRELENKARPQCNKGGYGITKNKDLWWPPGCGKLHCASIAMRELKNKTLECMLLIERLRGTLSPAQELCS